MILKGISVNQDPPTKDYLWITPKGNTRFWNQSTWRLIGGDSSGGTDLPVITDAGKYLVTTGTAGNYGLSWGTIDISSKADKSIQIGGDGIYLTGGGDLSANRTISLSSTYQTLLYNLNNWFGFDSTNNAVYVKGNYGFYSNTWVSALGPNSSSGGGGGGGMDEIALWQELTNNPNWDEGDDKIINVNYLPDNINADQLDGYHASYFLPKSGGTMTGILNLAKIRINTTHSSSSTSGGIYYNNGTTDYLLIGQGSSNLWIGANETSGTHHIGSTYISAGDGDIYASRLVNGTRTNYKILDAGNTSLSGNSVTINGTSVNFLPLSGGTMTGNLNLKPNQYNREGALNCNNSDIVGVNSILTNDASENFGECIGFYRSASTWDCMAANNGTFYFGEDKVYGSSFDGSATICSGGITTSNLVVYPKGACYTTSTSSVTGAIKIRFPKKYTSHMLSFWVDVYNYNGDNDLASYFIGGYNYSGTSSWYNCCSTCIGSGAHSNLTVRFGDDGTYCCVTIGETNTTWQYPQIVIRDVYFGYSTFDYGYIKSWNISFITTLPNISKTINTYELWVKTGIRSSGYITALAAASSDKRLKKEIKPFNAKQIIDKLNPVEFEWNKKANKYNKNLELNKKNYGLIAQDSDNIIDDFVFDLPDNKGYKGIRYEKLTPILLQAIKEQQSEIDELKKLIKDLKYEIYNKRNS